MSHLSSTGTWRQAVPLLLFLTLAVVVAATVTIRRATPSWEDTLRLVHQRYPDVRPITVPELAAWLADSSKPPPLLLDVRTIEEFLVSHLAGAVRIAPGSPEPRLPQDTAKDTPIVTYCAVGQRSSAIAQRLQQKGYTHVVNLEGSIFAWANAGHPVVRDGEEVREVHPFSDRWGRLLLEDLRAESP